MCLHFIITDCQKSISNCIDCTTDSPTGEPMCLECDEGFTLSATNTTCIGRSKVKCQSLNLTSFSMILSVLHMQPWVSDK